MEKPPRKRHQQLSGKWPAPTTTFEKIQIAALIAIIGISAAVGFTPPTQLLTPIPLLWWLVPTIVGVGVGFRLSRLLARVNRFKRTPSKDWLGAAITITVAAMAFCFMGWSIAGALAFRDGGTQFTGTYRVLKCTAGKHDYEHWVIVNPFGLTSGAMVPITKAQYDQITANTSDSECQGDNLCVRIPSERAPNGAVRIFATADSAPVLRPVQSCTITPEQLGPG